MKEFSREMQSIAGAIARAPGPLTQAVSLKARHHLLDSLAAVVSGSRLLPGQLAVRYVEQFGGRKEACVPGTRLVTSAVHAAMASGMCAHADETDDSHQPAFFHPGCAIVPAAWAMAEREHSSGRDLLESIVLGYEIGARISLTLGAMAFHQRGLSSHTFAGVFGAAAACGRLARFDLDQSAWLLSYVAQQASGISTWMRDRDHVEKAFALGGMTARNAVYAATMVQFGMTAVDDVFAGSPNFFSAFSPGADIDPLLADFDGEPEIMRANIKKWSVGSPIQAALDAMESLIRAHRLQAEEIGSIHIEVRDDEAAIVDDRTVPNICIQHLVSLLAVDGTLTFESSHDAARMNDPRVLALRRRVTFAGSAALRHAGGRQAVLEVSTTDGRRMRQHVEVVRGAAGNAMSDDEVTHKATGLMVPVLGKRRTARLVEAVWDIELAGDVAAVRPLMKPARAA
ncbi:MmgE/PrpD family protein [soil metagenome]